MKEDITKVYLNLLGRKRQFHGSPFIDTFSFLKEINMKSVKLVFVLFLIIVISSCSSAVRTTNRVEMTTIEFKSDEEIKEYLFGTWTSEHEDNNVKFRGEQTFNRHGTCEGIYKIELKTSSNIKILEGQFKGYWYVNNGLCIEAISEITHETPGIRKKQTFKLLKVSQNFHEAVDLETGEIGQYFRKIL